MAGAGAAPFAAEAIVAIEGRCCVSELLSCRGAGLSMLSRAIDIRLSKCRIPRMDPWRVVVYELCVMYRYCARPVLASSQAEMWTFLKIRGLEVRVRIGLSCNTARSPLHRGDATSTRRA